VYWTGKDERPQLFRAEDTMGFSAKGVRATWRVPFAGLLVGGFLYISTAQTPEVVSTYTLESWQNQPDKTDRTDHKPVRVRSLMACTNIEPKRDGNECLLRFENDGKMYLQYDQTITATSTDEVSLSCVGKEPGDPISCEATITVLKYENGA
jgi:predicted SAM-dependent methyltransferase